MQASLVPLKPASLVEWEGTDLAWWNLLASAQSAWQQGREGMAAARKATAAATAHMRRK